MDKKESPLNTKKSIGIVPSIGHNFEAMFTEKNTFYSEHEGQNPMFILAEVLKQNGIEFYDATKTDSVVDFDLIFYFGNIDTHLLLKYKDLINVYLAFEPPAVDFTNDIYHLRHLSKYFDYILSWNDDLIDGMRFLKLNYCVNFFHYEESDIFESKKLLTNISGCKRSNHKDELYSERLNVINYFESFDQNDFEFWGTGWDKHKYHNYRGLASSKIDIYKNNKFAVCFENQRKLRGYITEKIWDCFICGIVPVYWGAENIDQYISRKCFIDYRDFNDIEQLYDYLKNMPEKEYNNYIMSIKNLLCSNKINAFKPEEFANTILDIIDKDKQVRMNFLKEKILRLFRAKIKVLNSIQTHGYKGVALKLLNCLKH